MKFLPGRRFHPSSSSEQLRSLRAEVRDLFDEDFYCAQLEHEWPDESWLHYCIYGAEAGLSPSPYIDGRFLAREFPPRAGLPSLVRYMRAVARGKDPSGHPLVDPHYYRVTYSEIGAEPALLHFARHGDTEGHRPSVGFDPDFYAQNYLDLNARNAFRHYATVGQRLGFAPTYRQRSHSESLQSMQGALGPEDVLIISHDAHHGGGPATALLLARTMREQGLSVGFVLLRGGPHVTAFQELGPTFLVPEGWEAEGLWDGVPLGTRVVANTGVTARVSARLSQRGHHVLLLVHEFPTSLMELGVYDDCLASVAAGVKVGFALPANRRAFDEEIIRLPAEQSILVGPPPLGEPATETGRAQALEWLAQHDVSAPRIAGAGFADYRKGFDVFLETARALHAQRPHIHFVWFGGLGDWGNALANEALRDSLPLSLPGHVEPFDAWISACDALLVTSRSDVGPATMLHAAREGIPVVAYDTELGARDYVQKLGMLVPPGDVGAAIDALLELMQDSDPSRIQRRLDTAAEFDATSYAERVLRTFDA